MEGRTHKEVHMERDWLTLGWKMLLVRGAVGIAVLLGVTALVWGVVLIAVGLSVRRAHSGPAHSSPAPA